MMSNSLKKMGYSDLIFVAPVRCSRCRRCLRRTSHFTNRNHLRAFRFLYFCVFFAFATFNPNIEFLVMFVIDEDKVDGMGPTSIRRYRVFIDADHRSSPSFCAPFLGYVLFFRDSFKQSMKSRQRRAQFESDRSQAADLALHTCEQCGVSDHSNPERDFRYKTIEKDMVCLCNVCRES